MTAHEQRVQDAEAEVVRAAEKAYDYACAVLDEYDDDDPVVRGRFGVAREVRSRLEAVRALRAVRGTNALDAAHND